MSKKRQSRTASKAGNKGRAVSVLLHSLLLLFAFLPFISMQTPEVPTKEALVIQFDYPYNQYVAPEKFIEQPKELASTESGSKAGGSTPSQEPIQPRPTEAAPSRLSAPTLTAVNRSTSVLSSEKSDIPLPQPKIVTHQAWQPVEDYGSIESDGVEELKMIEFSGGKKGDIAGSGDGDDDSDIWNDGFGNGTGGSGTGSGGGPGNATGTGSGPGGGTGTGGAGKGSGIGGVTSGIKPFEAFGEGDLNRSLIKRPASAAQLAVKQGKICVYICVDRNGKVVSSQYNAAKSTLKDVSLLVKAQDSAKDYVFTPDIMAPDKQCGNFYFVFKFD
ncbi:MAG TPA: hypothetical protein VMZ69_05630 [Saprospiraceae bacterium]|nr:hypothetical protein [Saprospiraceae bacterium]